MTLAKAKLRGAPIIGTKGGITVAAKHKIHEIKPGIPIHLFLKMEPTDLQKFGNDVHVTLLASKRAPVPGPGKGPKTPKKTKK